MFPIASSNIGPLESSGMCLWNLLSRCLVFLIFFFLLKHIKDFFVCLLFGNPYSFLWLSDVKLSFFALFVCYNIDCLSSGVSDCYGKSSLVGDCGTVPHITRYVMPLCFTSCECHSPTLCFSSRFIACYI